MANKRLNAVISIGGTVTGGLKSALGTTQRGLRGIGDTVRDLERQQKRLGATLKNPGDLGMPVYHLQRRYEALGREIDQARHKQERMTRAVRRMDGAKSNLGNAAGGLATVGAVAATGLIPIVQAAQFETAMGGVAKQVDGARDKGGKLTKVYWDMAKGVQNLGREIPIATNELAAMVEAGARMGVGKNMGATAARKQLLEFTRVTAEMGTALQLPTAELADDMGKIANLYKMPIPAMREMGDAINYLDDNAISKGGDIIAFLRRTGGVAGSVKVTGKEMAALGSTLLSLGEPAESASTATNAFFQKLAAADKGSKKFHRAMQEIGLSTTKVQKGMQIDAQGTILQVIEAVNRLPKEKRLGALVDLVGLEHSDTLAKLVSGIGEYRKQIDLVNSQKAKGSMGREFAANLATTNAQWEISKNRVREVGVNLGTVLLPAVNDFLGKAGAVASGVADWSRENPRLVQTLGSATGAVLTATVAWKGVRLAMAAGQLVMAGVAVMQGRVAAQSSLAATALNAETVAMNRQAIAGKRLVGVKGLLGKVAGVALTAGIIYEINNQLQAPDNTKATRERGERALRAGRIGEATRNLGIGGFMQAALFKPVKSSKGAAPAGGKPSAAPVWPKLPAPAPRGGTVIHDNSKTTFHIIQQPGQSSKSLADEIEARRKERGTGSLLYDRPRGQ